jgi:prophage regulatory protein
MDLETNPATRISAPLPPKKPVRSEGLSLFVATAPEDLHSHNFPPERPSARVQLAATCSAPDDISFLRLPDVLSATGMSKSTIYAMIRADSFPAPVPLGPHTVGWVRSEVQSWAAERVRLRDAA